MFTSVTFGRTTRGGRWLEGFKSQGVESGIIVVAALDDDSPTARAGLRVGDAITSGDALPLLDMEEIRRAVLLQKEGARIRIGFERDGQVGQANVGFVETDEQWARKSAWPADEKIDRSASEALVSEPNTSFGNGDVPNGRLFSLRMNGLVGALQGETRQDGFTLRIVGRQALDRASPIAATHPAVASAMVLNRGGFAELTIDFVHGLAPRYRVVGNQDTIQITIEQL